VSYIFTLIIFEGFDESQVFDEFEFGFGFGFGFGGLDSGHM
jgi:hypothetical protein